MTALPDPSQPLNLRLVPPSSSPSSSSSANPKPHPRPLPSQISPWQFTYQPPHDGKEQNLLVMFHGLGDTEKGFEGLGRGLKLPGTAVISLRGRYDIPIMDAPSYSHLPLSISSIYDPTSPPPNPHEIIPSLISFFRYLVYDCGWDLERIHLFGWGEGGSVVLEVGRWVGMNGLGKKGETSGKAGREAAGENHKGNDKETEPKRFGSAISICGPLLSEPSITSSNLSLPTPVCYFHRPSASSTSTRPPKSLTQTFSHITHLPSSYSARLATENLRTGKKEDCRMPVGKEEWMGVMRFWGEVLVPADGGEGWMKGLRGKDRLGEMYEVVR